jgi:hypothetical protein
VLHHYSHSQDFVQLHPYYLKFGYS